MVGNALFKILYQTMYVDRKSGIIHFIYANQTSRAYYPLYYVRFYNHYVSSDITGADDGRHIYIAACVNIQTALNFRLANTDDSKVLLIYDAIQRPGSKIVHPQCVVR